MAFTSQNLLDSIDRRGFVPTGQGTFTDTELLAIADEEMGLMVVPEILSVREEYMVFYKDYAITSGVSVYAIPPRAVGLSLREVHLISTSSTTDLPRFDLEAADTTQTGAVGGYYVRGNSIVLDKIPNTTADTLRAYFAIRPGNLIAVASSAVISAINTTTKVVTVTSIPATWTTGVILDFVNQNNGHEYLTIDNTSTLVSGSNITFSALPSTLAVGDYVMPAGYTSLVQCPVEFTTVLAQAVAANIQDAMGLPGADRAFGKLKTMIEAAKGLIRQRVIGEVQTVLPADWI